LQEKRSKQIAHQKRWGQFKEERHVVVEKYLRLKRVLVRLNEVAKQIKLYSAVRTIWGRFSYAARRKAIKMRSKFMSLIFAKRWVRRSKKYGPTHEAVLRRKYAKKSLTFAALVMFDESKRQAQVLLSRFLQNVTDVERRVKIFQVFRERVVWVQDKIRLQMLTRFSKVEVLINYWDKLLGQIQTKASAWNDKKVTQLCGQIVLVPAEVQYNILRKFVTACRVLYATAFCQWRLKFPSKVKIVEEEIVEILEQKYSYLNSKLAIMTE
jgi:hypothetical protein